MLLYSATGSNGLGKNLTLDKIGESLGWNQINKEIFVLVLNKITKQTSPGTAFRCDDLHCWEPNLMLPK